MPSGSRLLRIPTERSWSWAPYKKPREVASFPALRVLFCGSDHFSIPSFTMLRELHLRRNDIVSDLAVITPSDKLSGRGLKIRKASPMTILAQKMKYTPTHISGSNLGLENIPLGRWDLIIAVSFGHKISAEVLDKVTHGGLNVHPSLLPRYRGAAPLHHALLNGDKETGVSLQTLHPTKFDHGRILMQSPPISIGGNSLDSLRGQTARLGADMLKDLLMRGYPVNAPTTLESSLTPSQAPKLRKNDLEIDWQTWSVDKIVRWNEVLGTLWTCSGDLVIKVDELQCFTGIPSEQCDNGVARMLHDASGRKFLVVRCIDGYVKIGRLTVSGKKEKPGHEAQELHQVKLGNS